MDWTWLWIPATLAAAAAQAGRNAVQRSLTETLGTLGATQVRFLFGFPFALLFLAVVYSIDGGPLPGINGEFLAFVIGGAVAQIAATALMLAAMRERSFVVVTAWTKTEPIQVAIFGFAVLGDPLSLTGVLAIVLATLGVVLMSSKGASATGKGSLRPALFGLVSGAFFALSAIGFRGAILVLDGGGFFLQSTWTLVWSLGIQSLILIVWMLLFNRALLIACMAAWRASIWGGLLGACASQGWFLGFALTAAANVRTLGLVEVLFAQILSRRIFAHTSSRRELLGIALIVIGVGILVAVAGR
ncbi:EamA family transporter [Bordetella sp. 15P40C-2]|nr:DMT family transporter [Bordetella sp. 15P40C-2]MVW70652.1 EamA family transporter [Bordetella sp. 15P40C-2]